MADLALPIRNRYWNWRRDLNYFFVALTEVLWVVPLLILLGMDAPPELFPEKLANVFVIVGGNLVGGLALRRYLIFRRLTTGQQFPYLIGGALLGALLTVITFPLLTDQTTHLEFNLIDAFTDFSGNNFPHGVIYTPIAILLWVRGYYLGRVQLSAVGVSVQMRLGILVYFFLGMVGNDRVRDSMLTLLPLFFASALMATSLARSATLHIQEETRQARFGLSWLGFISIIVAVLTMGSYIVALFFAGIDRDKALDVLELIGTGIVTLILILLTPFFWVGEKIYQWFVANLIDEPTVLKPEGTGTREPVAAREVDRLEYGELLEKTVGFVTDWLAIIVIVIVLAVVIYFWISVFLARDDHLIGDESHETLESREIVGGLRKALGNQIRKIGDMFNMVRQFGVGRGLVGVLTIRWAYARMEREAKKRGYPRDKAKTPYEYRREVNKAFPGGERFIQTITDAYVAIRYGEVPENNDQLDMVREALDQLLAIEAPS